MNEGLYVLFAALPYALPVLLILAGLFVGGQRERRHYDSIRIREQYYLDQPAINFLKHTGETDRVVAARLVTGSAVISIDYFKRFVAALINLVGGRVETYESLLDRARREAVLRMQAQAEGMDSIVNVRIETSTISSNAKGGVGCVEALAYGTALKYR